MSGKNIFLLFFSFGIIVLACNTSTYKSPGTPPVKNENARNDAWGYVGYGGGGAMFYPAVSPFNPEYAFVACDMTGSYVTYDGGEHWRMFNLGAPVNFFAFDPNDANVVYANAEALYKSADRGVTWKIFYPAEENISAIIAKGDHATNVVVTKDSITRKVQALAVDPLNAKKLYAGIMVNGQSGIYASADGGIQWQKELDVEEPVKNIFADPSAGNDRTWYVATAKGLHVKRSGKWSFNKIPPAVKTFTTFSAGYNSSQQKMIIYAVSGTSYFNDTP
ncbi:MAG TPA: hypothetical protein PLR74_18330, partial [Agriterribacter sp.]|nr:hypothetical protein [Agriterribacter sp.]